MHRYRSCTGGWISTFLALNPGSAARGTPFEGDNGNCLANLEFKVVGGIRLLAIYRTFSSSV